MSYKKKPETVQDGECRELITARIDRLIEKEGSSLLAIASINIADCFAVHGIKLMQTDNGRFVAMPSNRYIDRGKTQYTEICHPITSVARCEMIDKVNEAYDEKMREVQARAQKGVGPSITQ